MINAKSSPSESNTHPPFELATPGQGPRDVRTQRLVQPGVSLVRHALRQGLHRIPILISRAVWSVYVERDCRGSKY